MANTLKFGNGEWYGKKDTILAYNDENSNYKPLPFDFSRASSATRVNKAGLIETVGSGQPRIDYKDDSKGALLLEPSRTNLITYSEDFSNAAWVKLGQGIGSAPIVTPNYAISPDGTLNASRLQCDLNGGNTTNDRSWLYQSISTITGDNTFSLYVKNNSNEDITFSLANGSSETVVVLSDDKWHRLSTVRSDGGQPRIGLIGGVGASDNADLLIYAAQIEAGSYATSYIPTSGSAVTRLADSCYQDNLLTDIINASYPFTMYAEAKAVFDSTQYFLTFGNRGASNQYFTLVLNNDGTIKLDARANGVSENLVSTASAISNGEFFKVAVSMESATSGKISVNGNLDSKTNFTQQSVNTDIKDLLIGQLRTISDTGQRIPISDVKLYNTALTDNELQQLTQV